MTIFFSGGGTAGSVVPLLALAEHLTAQQLHFIGTVNGIEHDLIPRHIRYHSILSGKLRRYWSWRNWLDPLLMSCGFFEALWLITWYQPSVVVSVGGYVAVPLVWAAWWCNVPVAVHQQDIQVGLGIRLMQPFASLLTKAAADTPLAAETIGNPVRNLTPTTNRFQFTSDLPVVLIFGGSTGAVGLNRLVTKALCEFAEVIHCTGKGRQTPTFRHPRYHQFTLLGEEMKEALAKADLVICRAGLATISELAVLQKPSIIIPMPKSHQEDNAAWLQRHQAAVVLAQSDLTPERFTAEVKQWLSDRTKLQALSQAIGQLNQPDAAKRLAQRLTAFVQ